MSTPSEYAKVHGETFVEELKQLLRIPSVSTLSEHKPDVRRAAEWVRDQCQQVGLENARLIETGGHPLVYAEWLKAGANVPTVLVYGHYDVQPVDDPRNEWQSHPFEPEVRDGKLYARGATDDKGQTFVHLKTFEAFMKTEGKFPLNVKFLIEGEEESGSRHLPVFVKENADLLRADVAVISDTHILAEDMPSIVYGLRGMVYVEVEVKGPGRDLHSGAYGGTVHNPAQALVEILSQLHDEHGRVTVPGFYDDVLALEPVEREALAVTGYTEERLKEETGVSRSWGDPDFTLQERIGARPTLEICGIVGGWTGEGGKTVIPASALAKVSCRLVPNQDPRKILKLLQDTIQQLTPPTVRSEVRPIHKENVGSPASVVSITSKPMQAAVEAYETVFGKKPVFQREGGSIPVVSYFQQELGGIPVILMGFGLPDDNLHSPNEKMTLSMFHKGIQTMIHFYRRLPELLG